MVSRMYTWPGITKDVQAWVKACPQCQGQNRAHSETAPLQLLPVLMEPFEVMAFDLVGPFTRSKEVILTSLLQCVRQQSIQTQSH